MTEAPQPGTTTTGESLGEKYFRERMELYGITPEKNKIKLWQGVAGKVNNELVECDVFKKCDAGIEITVYSLDRNRITFKPEQKTTDDGQEVEKRTWSRDYKLIRYHTPHVDAKGSEHKYHIPKGAGSYPFFPPALVEKFEKKEKIKTLVATEGYFKAFKASMHGLDIVGLSSITHYKDKQKGTLHTDILKLIKECQVENFIWLADGDCNRISLKALNAGDDIFKRPNQFFNSCHNITGLLKDFEIFKYFAYVDSSAIEGDPKGLDDALVLHKGKEQEIIEDLLTLGKTPKFFWRDDMTNSTQRIRKQFRLHNVNEFVEFHTDQIEEARKRSGAILKDQKDLKHTEFTWNGTKYKWDDKENSCIVVIPGAAKSYFRVGDIYFKKIAVPNKHGDLENTFARRQKQTIIDDHGKKFVDHVPKYEQFCNVPDHANYQEIIHNCYNMYFPFEHEAAPGDCSGTLRFLRHIFGEGKVAINHKEKGKLEYNELDLGIDYVQLLYQKPQQILPILCLVSKEQGTGKTTFVNWLKLLFTQNVAIVGNADLANDFNASWAGKLLVVCEEAKIDKTVVVERVKALSTGSKIFMNAKGKDHVEMDFFAKFIFNTNNEENFIYASEDDVRYWVRKVPPVQSLFVDLLEELKEEIPAFLEFLNKRKMATEKLHRAWFDPGLIKTDALKKVIAFSQSTVEKELREHFRTMFFEHGGHEYLMTLDAIKETFFRHKNYENKYLRTVLTDRLKLEMYHEFLYKDVTYKTMDALKTAAGEEFDLSQVKKIDKIKRHSFPKWERVMAEGRTEKKRVYVNEHGRPYIIPIEKFLHPDEINTRWVDAETKKEYEMHQDVDHVTVTAAAGQMAINEAYKDDLPF